MCEREVLLEASRVSKHFSVPGPDDPDRKLVAVNEVSFKAYRGETLGIVGESGCGKSTLVKALVNLHPVTEGGFFFRGRNISTLKGEELRQSRRHIQMVFQDPLAAFNPRLTVEDIICEPLLNFGRLRKKDRRAKTEELLGLVELPASYAARRPHDMSGGQRQRVGIARALALEPEIIVCDEATSALDVSVQKKIIELLTRLQKEKGLTMLFICHDLALVQSLCHQVAIMYLGNIVEVVGNGRIQESVHPYTKALLSSIFPVKKAKGFKIKGLSGEVPSPLDTPPGCSFQNRCEHADSLCRSIKPDLREISPGHQVACHLLNRLEDAAVLDAA